MKSPESSVISGAVVAAVCAVADLRSRSGVVFGIPVFVVVCGRRGLVTGVRSSICRIWCPRSFVSLSLLLLSTYVSVVRSGWRLG